jgi:hypothetical protein
MTPLKTTKIKSDLIDRAQVGHIKGGINLKRDSLNCQGFRSEVLEDVLKVLSPVAKRLDPPFLYAQRALSPLKKGDFESGSPFFKGG